jgi:hypothetical protein
MGAWRTRSAGSNLTRWRRFINFSTWPAVLVSAAAGFEGGVAWMSYFERVTLDSGVAAIAAALITIGGGIWAVQFAAMRRDAPFADFIADGAGSVWLEAKVLSTVCMTESEGPGYPRLLCSQIGQVVTHIRGVEHAKPNLTILDYHAQVEIGTMLTVFQTELVLLQSEAAELQRRPTPNVVRIARKKLSKSATRLAHSCASVCAAVGRPDRTEQEPTANEVVAKLRPRTRSG